jgi:hypothetical protein
MRKKRGIKNRRGGIYSEFWTNTFIFKFSPQKQIPYFNDYKLYKIIPFILWHVNPLLGNARNTHTVQHTTTGLFNPFLGNGSVNTLPRGCNDVMTTVGSCHVTCVFYRQQPAPMDWLGSHHVTCVFCETYPCCVFISEQNSEAEAVSWRSTGEYKKPTCED